MWDGPVSTWGYRRSYRYGSPHLKADGRPGQDWQAPISTYLSRDLRTVFVGVPGMKTSMQLRVEWSLATAGREAFSENAYLTPYELVHFDPVAEGFGSVTVDSTSARGTRPLPAKPALIPTARGAFTHCLAASRVLALRK